MLKPIEKIVFTPTGEVRPPKVGEYYTIRGNSVFYNDEESEYLTKYPIYTKSIELVQPDIEPNKTYWFLNNQQGTIAPDIMKPDIMFDRPSYLRSGNIYSTKEEAQQVADQINLLIQEKGYFTSYPENPEGK